MIDLSKGASYSVGKGSVEELVAKALTSTTPLTAAQWLSPDQTSRFIRMVVDETLGLKNCTVMAVDGPQLDITNMDIADGQYAVGLGGTDRIDEADEVTPAFDRRILSPETYDFRLPISQTRLKRWNIERDNIQQTADEMMATYIGNTLEDEAWNAAAGGPGRAGYGTGALTTVDGWFQTAIQAGHVVDFNGARLSSAVLRELLKAMPTKWRNKGEEFSCSSNSVLEWGHYLELVRATNLGDVSITDDGVARFRGIPVVPVPKIRDDYEGLNALSGSTTGYTRVLLTAPENKVLGHNPEMRNYVGMRDDGKVAYINAWGQYDYDFINVDRVVVGINILPLAATTAS